MSGTKQGNVQHHYKSILVGLFYVALFSTSLVFNNHTVGWGSIENYYYFYFVAIAIFLVYTVLSFAGIWPVKPGLNKIDGLFLLLCLYQLIQVPIIDGKPAYHETHFTILHLTVLYFIVKSLSQQTGRWLVPAILTLAGVIAAGYGFLQLLGWVGLNSVYFKMTGFFLNPGPHGAYLAAVLPFALVLLVDTKKTGSLLKNRLLRGGLWISLLLLLTACMLSGSRTAILSGAAGMLYILNERYHLLQLVQRARSHKKWLIALALITTLVIAAFLFYAKVDSSYGRLLIWKISTNLWWDDPIFGIGSGRFAVDYANYQAAYFAGNNDSTHLQQLAGMTYFAFNEWLQIGVELGVVGLLLFATLFYHLLKIPARTPLALGSKAGIVVVLVQTFFFYPLSVLPIQLFFTFCIATVASSLPGTPLLPLPTSIRRAITLVSFILAGFFLVYQANTFRALRQWKKAAAIILFQEKKALSIYQDVYPRLQYKGEFLFNYGAELSKLGSYQKSITLLEAAKKKFSHIDLYMFLGNGYKALGQYAKAEQSYQHAAHMIPHRFYPKYLLVQLYRETNQTTKARRLAKEIMNAEPKVTSNEVAEIKHAMKKFLNNETPI